MMNLDKLTKQLDALTYNARSVLNALVRSTMAAGSYNGFTATRGGEDVTLNRTDIFRLYTFYQDWAYKLSYQGGASFDELLTEHDNKYIGNGGSGTPTTDALIKHAKLMYQNNDNVGSPNEFWIGLVRDNANPKLVTNSAPIPINIRTPIYDENLSTKHFDQFETYLFPNSYHTLDILGYKGDGIDHAAGGKTWEFNVDKSFTVEADKVLLGVHSNDNEPVRAKNILEQSPLYALMYGTESYAYGRNAFAGGNLNEAVGNNAVAIGGTGNIAYGDSSVVLGGIYNNAVVSESAIIVGDRCSSTSYNSIVSGYGNNAGGFAYTFQRYTVSPNELVETDCEPTYTNEDGCTYSLNLASDSSSNNSTVRSLSSTQVYITEYERGISGIGDNRISAGDSSKATSPFDFKVGDTVKLFRFSKGSSPTPTNAGTPISARVDQIEKYNNGYIITLDRNITAPSGFVGTVLTGRIMRSALSGYPLVNSLNSLINNVTVNSSNAIAFNYNTIAGGNSQTVVGTSNSELIRPTFIVGNGSSYVNVSTTRSNGLVVAENYAYMKPATNYIGMGTSKYGTAYLDFGGAGDDEDYGNRRFDEDYQYGLYKFAGAYAYSIDSAYETKAVSRVYYKKSEVTINDNGIRIYQPYQYSLGNNVNVLTGSKDGAVIIHAGDDGQAVSQVDDKADVEWKPFYEDSVERGKNDKSLVLWSSDNVGVHGLNIVMDTNHYIFADWGHIRWRGETYGELPTISTDAGVEAHKMRSHGVIRTNNVADSGFYYGDLDYAANSSTYFALPSAFNKSAYEGGVHVLNSTIAYKDKSNKQVFDIAQLILPGKVTSTHANHGTPYVPHLRIVSHEVYGRGNEAHDPTAVNENYLAEEIAYMSDVAAGKEAYNHNVPTNPYVYSGTSSETGDNWLSNNNDGKTPFPGEPYMISTCDYFEKAVGNNGSFYSATNHLGRFISTPTFKSAYGTKLRKWVDEDYFTYFLNGIGINPAYQMRFWGNGNATDYQGFGFMGFAPRNLPDAFSNNNGPKNHLSAGGAHDGHAYRLTESSSTRSIMTSPHSRSDASYGPVDMSDVWVTMLDRSSSNAAGYWPRWVKLLENLQISFVNGTLVCEFDFYPMLRCAGVSDANRTDTIVRGLGLYVKPFTIIESNPSTVQSGDASLQLGGSYSDSGAKFFDAVSFPLPVVADFAKHIQVAGNYHNGVYHNMWGRAYYTGNQNVSVSGYFSNSNPVFGHNSNHAAYRSYAAPVINVNMAGFGDLAEGTAFHVRIEGVARYVV